MRGSGGPSEGRGLRSDPRPRLRGLAALPGLGRRGAGLGPLRRVRLPLAGAGRGERSLATDGRLGRGGPDRRHGFALLGGAGAARRSYPACHHRTPRRGNRPGVGGWGKDFRVARRLACPARAWCGLRVRVLLPSIGCTCWSRIARRPSSTQANCAAAQRARRWRNVSRGSAKSPHGPWPWTRKASVGLVSTTTVPVVPRAQIPTSWATTT